MKKLWATILLLFSIFLFPVVADNTENAFELLNNGKFSEAQALFTEIIQEEGENHDLLIGLGRSYLYQDMLDESLNLFDKAIAEYNTPLASFFRGYNYYKLGNVENSKSDYLKAIDLGYDNFDVFFNLGFMSFQENNFPDSESWFRKSIDKNQKHDQSWYYLAVSKHRQNKDAFYEFSKTIEINPDYLMAYVYRGFLYEDLGENTKAVSDYSKAVELNPDYAWGRYYLGNALEKIRDNENAITHLKKALTLGLNDGRVYDSLAGVYWSLKDYFLAEVNYNKAVEAAPDLAWIVNNRGYFYRQRNIYDLAIKDFRKAIEMAPEWALPYNNLGYTYNKKGEQDLAIAPLEKAIELAPLWSWPWNNYGNALKEVGRIEDAISSYLKSFECDPQYAYPFYNLGILYHHEKEYEKAVEHYQKSLDINPNQSNCYNNMGNSLVQLNRIDDAIESFTKGLEVNPNNKDIPGNRGRQYYNTDRYEEAVKDLMKAVEIKPDSAYFHKYLGMSLFELSRFYDAREHLQLAINLDSSNASTLSVIIDSIKKLDDYLIVYLLWDDFPQEDLDVTFLGLPDYDQKFITDSNGSILIPKNKLTLEKTYRLYDGDYKNPTELWDYSNTSFTYSENMVEVYLQVKKKMIHINPSNEAVLSTSSPRLNWESPEGANTFTLTISSKKEDMEKGIKSYIEFLKLEDLRSTEYQIRQVLQPNEYLWSVTAYSDEGIPLYFSSNSFSVE